MSNKNVEEIITYLAYTSPTFITNSSKLTFYTSEPNTVYNTKPQLEVVEYITKSTGLFLMELMSFPDNSSYYRSLIIRLISTSAHRFLNISIDMQL